MYYLLSLINPINENNDLDATSQLFLDEVTKNKTDRQKWIENTSKID